MMYTNCGHYTKYNSCFFTYAKILTQIDEYREVANQKISKPI